MIDIPKISIIVPVYNVEKYLSRCVDSILKQTITDWELLLIDDGSKDVSGAICDKYAAQDERISVYHIENGGVSNARNLGLDKAKGEWIVFVDADDWVEARCLEVSLQKVNIHQLDIIQFGYYNAYSNKEIKIGRTIETEVMNGMTYLEKEYYNYMVWGGMIRKSLIQDNHLKFNTELRYGEDTIFVLNLIPFAKRVKHIYEPLYYYYRDNLTSAIHNKRSIDLLAVCNQYVEIQNKYPAVIRFSNSTIIDCIFTMVMNQDIAEPLVSDLFKRAKISIHFEFKYQLYVYIANINPTIAFYLLRCVQIIKKPFKVSFYLKLINILCHNH